MALSTGILHAAIEAARKSTYRVKLGAVVFKGKRILSTGWNQIRSSSLKHKNYENSLHAEQSALLGLEWKKLKGCSMLVVKISRAEERLGNARPCDMCMQLMNYIGIKDVFYSNENGEIVKLKED